MALVGRQSHDCRIPCHNKMQRHILAFLLVFGIQISSLEAKEDSWENDDGWIVFISQHKELYDKVYPIAKRMRRDTVSSLEKRKLLKMMKGRSETERVNIERILNHIRKRHRFDAPIYNGYRGIRGFPGDDLEEVVVIGRMFDQFPIDPGEFSYRDILGMRGIRMNANELYRDGKYDDAYPLLLELAKRGFKDAQSRLAYILLTGTENVEKSNLRALGWLGTAAHGESEPMFRVLFKKYMAQVPESVRPTVDSVLAGYREQFDSSAYVDCTSNHRFKPGVVKRTYCQFDLEAKVEACQAGRFGGTCWAHSVNPRVE